MSSPTFFNSENDPIIGFSRETHLKYVPDGSIGRFSDIRITIDETIASKETTDMAIMRLLGIETDKESKAPNAPKAKRVYLNDPYTIVIWDDGTKTLIKAQDGDEYDDKVGLLFCGIIKASNNRVRAVDFEDAIRAVAKLDERQMRALSVALEITADNFGEEDE